MNVKTKTVFAIFVVLLVFINVSGCLGGSGSTTTPATSTQGEYTSTGETTETYSETGTGEETTTATSEYATWANPWDASKPVRIGDGVYRITYLKYSIKVRQAEGTPVYEYEVEKRRGPGKVTVYGTEWDMQTGEARKVELGEYDAYEYYGKLIPINADQLDAPVEYWLWGTQPLEFYEGFFLFPIAQTFGMGYPEVIGFKIKYKDNVYEVYNPSAVGKDDYDFYMSEGFSLADVPDTDLTYTAFFAMTTFGFWGVLEEENLMTSTEGSYGFMNYQYKYKIEPQGTTSIGEKTFKTVRVEWSYIVGDARGNGWAIIAPNLPVPLEAEGLFVAGGTNIYSYMKLEDIGFEEE
ncbi:hypothetical protein A3L14_01755 [Thermococcus thioreducens]|nr:hypothetical protein A3L14_01755 [Thermococcus thioreducens]SEW15537.1 hypothetical protein SAMN05216170_1930 [Thermococcus thioreducens]